MTQPPYGPPAGYPDPSAYVPPAPPLTVEQARAQAAAQIAAQAGSAEASGDAAEMADRVREQVTRDVLLPMEQQMQALMDDWRKVTDSQSAQIRALQAQLAGAQAVMGPPPVQKYATAVAERLQTAASTSGLPKEHWAPVLSVAQQLAQAVDDALASGDVSGLAPLAGKIERFATTVHPRLSNVHIEHFPALLGDLAELGQAAERMAAAVA